MKKFNKNQALTEISVYKETFIEKTNFNELHKQKCSEYITWSYVNVSGKFKKRQYAESETNVTKKTWLNWLKNRFKPKQKQPINYNFNMKEFFTLEGKIEENRRFLRETQDKYEKIRSYYPLFFIYIGVIGAYTFEMTKNFINTYNCSLFYNSFGLLLFGHILFAGYCFYLFTKILLLKDINVEAQPKLWYSQYDNLSGGKTEFSDEQLEAGCKEQYLEKLEGDNKDNFDILKTKKEALSKVIKYSVYSFIIYICLIFFYKTTNMDTPQKPKDPIEVKISNPKDLFIPPVTMIKDSKEHKGNLLLEKQISDTTTIKITKKQLVEIIREVIKEEDNKKK